ncbi:MAG: hypothetical protein NVV73_02760 [Cellvibrionaceae bacterium]|nr:hypothetical protein [Cellvibrionaceae bacterium]
METLRLFATFETALSLSAQAKRLRGQGWRITGCGDGLEGVSGNLKMQLEPSGDELFMLRGEVAHYPSDDADALLTFLRNCAVQFQLDVFEEDGRLIRRLSNLDADG